MKQLILLLAFAAVMFAGCKQATEPQVVEEDVMIMEEVPVSTATVPGM